MAFINLLHNGYQGKLGETVGQKWKNQRTVRTYNPHNNSKSEAQLDQREFYKQRIQLASENYQKSRNLVTPKKLSMNNFNFYTRIISEIDFDAMNDNYEFTIADYNKRVWTDIPFMNYRGDFGCFISRLDWFSKNPEKDFKLTVISPLGGVLAAPEGTVDITPAGCYKASHRPPLPTAKETFGLLILFTGTYTATDAGKVMCSLAHRKGNTWERTSFRNCAPVIYADENIVTILPD